MRAGLQILRGVPVTDVTFPDFLPGKFFLQRGCARDYHNLAAFHYVAKRPATWADVWVVRFVPRRGAPGELLPDTTRTIAIGVLSYPVPSCGPRERFLSLPRSRNDNLRFANAHIRTISRVIVHPQFRSLGLSTLLVRCLCEHCDTRYVEAIAQMGRVTRCSSARA